ncbi:MAG: glycosyltransferase family 4 protein [Cytophagales bacterium]|nr:glycosyltransferase family 4 protein [Cytophagales bacterium]
MRIGMILDASFPPDPRVENEAVTLIQAGHEVFLFCFDFTGDWPQKEEINGIHVRRIQPGKLTYKLSALAYTVPFYHWTLASSLRAFIETNAVEALHIHDMQVAQGVFEVNKQFKLPVTIDLHENRPEIMRYYKHVSSGMGKWLISPKAWKRNEYRFIQEADKVVVVTDEARDYYVEEIPVAPEKFYVVPNTIREDFYTKFHRDETIISQYKDHFTLLYVGDTGYRRGLKTVIEALDLLVPSIKNLKVVIVGDSTYDDTWKQLVAESGHEAHVDLKGWQSFELFQSYILAADIGICPIHRNIHHDTTFANKLFQYMAFGKPIVVSDCPSQANLVRKFNTGLVHKAQDSKGFAAQVLKLYQDKALYEQLSENASQATKNELNWKVLSKQIVKAYEAD